MDTPHNNSKSDIEPEHLSAVPVPAAQRQAQDAPVGAPLSNTAPSNCIEGIPGTKILQTGVDSLYLSYAGELKPDVEKSLESLKKDAQSEDPVERAGAVYPLCDHRFEVKDKGKGRYPFVLEDGIFHLQLSRIAATSLPMLYAQIRSEALTRTGARYSEIALNNLATVLAAKLSPALVSRSDLCADFVTNVDLENIHKIAWLNRARHRSIHSDQCRFSGITFGMGGVLSARLYDKTLEIYVKSGKTYLYDIWREAGWDGVSPVWRLEFQLERLILKEFGISSVEELLARRADLWAYAMQWLRLVVPSETDKTKARWPNDPLWDYLTSASWGVERAEPLTRCRKTRAPSERALFINGLGAITSFMAWKGISDFDEGLRRYGISAHDYHKRESLRTGKNLSDYAREKALIKTRLYNTTIDSGTFPPVPNPTESS